MAQASLEQVLSGPLAAIYLVVGDEALLVKQAEEALTKRALDGVMEAFNHGVWRAGEEGADACLSVARTLPMMSPRRVLVLRDVHEAPSELLEALASYAEAPADTAVLICSGRSWPKAKGTDWGKRAENRIKKSGVVLRFRSKDSDPVGFAVDAAAQLGVELRPAQARTLVELVGKDLGRLQRELEKAALYAGGEGRLSDEALEEVCSLLAEAQIWDLTDAIVTRDANAALATAHRLLEASKRGESHRLISMINWQIRQLLQLQAGANVRMPGWKRQKMERALRDHPLDPAEILGRLAQANEDMNGHRAGDRRVFEGLLLDLVARR
ncbi:MAG: DNA polymerase III subunit delta [Myxococcota bacterium]|nr:DNA polymerase III subunit delta [Myxococcota bacterium]